MKRKIFILMFICVLFAALIVNASGGDSPVNDISGDQLNLSALTSEPCNSPIVYGQAVNGSLTTSDCTFGGTGRYLDSYTFNGTAGHQIAVTMNSTQFDAFLMLAIPSTGQVIAQDDSSAGGTNARIPGATGYFTLPATGVYQIIATSGVNANPNTGDYRLVLTQRWNGTCNPTNLYIGQTTGNSLSATSGCTNPATNRSADVYTFSGTAGQRIYLIMTANLFDTYLYLLAPDGQIIGQEDSGGGNLNARIPENEGYITLPSTGTYTIYATSGLQSSPPNGSSYLLKIIPAIGALQGGAACTPTFIGFNPTAFSGGLAASDCILNTDSGPRRVDVYTFAAPYSKEISISLNSTAFNAYLYLLDGAGRIIDEDNNGGNSSTNARIPAGSGFKNLFNSGIYTIYVTADAGAGLSSGSYSLTLTQIFPTQGSCSVTPINFSQTVSGGYSGFLGCIAGGDGRKAFIYSFNGSAGQRISVTGTYSDPFTSMTVQLIRNNTLVEFQGEEQIAYLPETGAYQIFAYGPNDYPATYTLTLNNLGNLRSKFDFNGDGKADMAVFRPSNGGWYIYNSDNGTTQSYAFGTATDKIVPADYDGDGKTDIAVYRSGTWYLQRSSSGFTGIAFGAATDIPVAADFNGDGKADMAVFRPSNGGWYQYNLATNQTSSFAFGTNSDVPVPADYDRDGKDDIAVFRPSTGVWYLQRSTAGFIGISFGQSGDKPVPADYDGDNFADIAVFRSGVWYILKSRSGYTLESSTFGAAGDIPVPADYDGDRSADIAVYRNGVWYLRRTTLGFTGAAFGASGDTPAPAAFIP